MAAFLPQRWRRQPTGAYQVDLTHPLTRGMIAWYSPTQRRNIIVHRTVGYTPTVTASFGTKQGYRDGIGETYNGTTNGLCWSRSSDNSGAMSVFAVARPVLNASFKCFAGFRTTDGTSRLNLKLLDTNVWDFQAQEPGTNVAEVQSTVTPNANRVDYLVGVYDFSGASQQKIAVNGTVVVGVTPTGSVITHSGVVVGYLERNNGFEQPWDGLVGDVCWWTRSLDINEMREMTLRPWQVIQPERRPVLYSIPATVAFKSAWAVNANTVIQSGVRAA